MDLLVSCIEGALDLIRNKLQIKIILYFKLIINIFISYFKNTLYINYKNLNNYFVNINLLINLFIYFKIYFYIRKLDEYCFYFY